MQNFHKTKKWINDIPTTEIITIYGDKDPSYSYIPFLECKKFENVKIVKIKNADHHFKGMMKEFIDLADRVMDEEKEK